MMKCICVRAGKYICAARGVRGQSRPYDRLLDRRTAALGGFMNENKVNGNIDGVRQSAIDRLREVYDIQVEGDCFAPPEIIERMAAFTAICNREVSVYISRDGRVMDITVGGPESVPLKSLRLRRNPGRLSMIRCIHTHPEGEARLSGVDRQALRSMNFDAMAAISVRGGKAREIGVGFLGEMGAGGKPVIEAFNKCDNLTERMPLPKGQFYVSARTGEGLDELLREIQSRAAAMLHRVRICVPYSKGQLVSRIHEQGNVISEEYDAEGTVIIATLDQIALDRISRELPVGGVELLGTKS